MKKFLLFTISIIVAFSLIACGGGEEKESQPHKESASESVTQSALSSEKESLPESEVESEGASESEKESVQTVFTVTFDTDGGNSISSLKVKSGEKITPPENPVKSSRDAEYEFIGWFWGEEEWNFDQDVVTCDITLVAKYKVVNSYTNPFLPKD